MEKKGWYTCFYWILFVILKTNILMNIVIAVIIEKLEENEKELHINAVENLYRKAIINFVETWQ